MQRLVGFDEPRQRPRLDRFVEDAIRERALLLLSDLLANRARRDAGDLQEVVAVRHQHRLGALEVTVVLQQPHQLLRPGGAC